MHLRSHRPWLGRTLAALFILSAVPASAQIINAGAGGHINFSSGFPPFGGPPGFVTTGVQPIPINGAYLFLNRFHASPQGYAEGATAIRALAAPFSYWFQVPTNSFLLQRRNACFAGAPPAELFTHFDAVFQTGAAGLPAHIATLSYPVVGRNQFGAGSFSLFWARLTFGMRPFPGGPITFIGTGIIGYSDFRPGAVFFVVPQAAVGLRAIPPNWQFLVWGDIIFRYRGCPPFAAFRANGLKIDSSTEDDGRIGVEDTSPDPPYDPSIPEVPIAPDDNVFMDMPVPELPTEGEGVTLIEMTEDHDTGDVNHRPYIDVIPDQTNWEDQTISFMASAVDMDNDPLTWSLADAPAGMAVDSFGNVTWTPPTGSAGVYQVKVRVTDAHGNLSQTDEQVVNITVEGVKPEPTPK